VAASRCWPYVLTVWLEIEPAFRWAFSLEWRRASDASTPCERRASPRKHSIADVASQYDGRNRLSSFWTPTGGRKLAGAEEDSHELLVRGGFLRQAHSGIFHLLPLGLRVQNKLEALIDKHMLKLGAGKVSLSSLSSEELWRRSGRLEGRDSEFLRLQDRKGAKYLLSPTHEEEITTIVANAVTSYKDLPLRLYQVSRKYRDEARPRQGLLRGREFLMKDLYTFDVTEQQARQTYEDVRKAYSAFLDELRLPYLVANADSGNMGGNLSHEYHFIWPHGEDNIISCENCDASINEELYVGTSGKAPAPFSLSALDINRSVSGISKDRCTLYRFVLPRLTGPPNMHLLKRIYLDLDTAVENPEAVWKQQSRKTDDADSLPIKYVVDPRLQGQNPSILHDPQDINYTLDIPVLNGRYVPITSPQAGDTCAQCGSPSLKVDKAVEIGHTFHLGTRYSEPLNAKVMNENNEQVTISMGCHGIGVSRLIGAVASLLADSKGLNWPVKMAPFSTVICPTPSVKVDDAVMVYDQLSTAGGSPDLDVAIDDRERSIAWKLNDADLIGYPFIVVLGKAWEKRGRVELQCRRLGVKEEVRLEELNERIAGCAQRL